MKILEAVEVPTIASKKLVVINKELQKLDFLKYDIDIENISYLQSIPRLLQDALIGLKSFVNANLSIDFSKITEPKAPPIKTNLSVGDLALLFRMLFELKPDIFEVKTKAELFRFISSNFTTKNPKRAKLVLILLLKNSMTPTPNQRNFGLLICIL